LVDALLAKAELAEIDGSGPFEEVVREYAGLFQREYIKAYDQRTGYPCAFLFCGYIGRNGKKIPQIVKLSNQNSFIWNPVATGAGYGFTGREQHGGVLYLHHRLYLENMPMDSAKCLAYCILSEVAELDNLVGGPIEMAVVTESGVEPFTGFDRYEKKRQQITSTVRSLIQSADGI
jgi:20S proteasome alpha/beta subunit